MSLSGALSVALSGLQVSTTAAQVISGNISNAQTPGYTEKSIDLSAITSGSSLGGVEISGYSRITNSVLAATLNNATSTASYLSTQNSYLSQVQSLLDSTDDPPALSSDLSNFQAAWTEYAANPSDTTLQNTVVSSGEALANTINDIASQTSILQTNVQNDLSTTVTSLNTALANIQTLNVQITAAIANNQPIVDLEDERDNDVNQIAQYTNVTVMQRDNGQIALYTSSGTALLDGQAQTFSVGPGANTILNAAGSDVTASLTGGSLQAQTDFLSTSTSTASGVGVITKLQSQLQTFANMFYAQTTDSSGNITNTGGSFEDEYVTNGGDSKGFFTDPTIDSNGMPDLSTFQVNPDLVNGTETVPAATAIPINNAFSTQNLAVTTTVVSPGVYASQTGSFQAAGQTTSGTYSDITTAILSGFQQAANSVKTQYATASTQQAYYQSSLSSQTGVDTDTELVNLTNWENSYAAAAHVISTIQSMMTVLEDMVGTA
jgi:flagellar hook-associated protein 1 FlgK